MTDKGHSIAVIGGGPTGLMAAEYLAQARHRVTLYDRLPNVGRKFLMAGRGGLNLTHSENLDIFLTKYRPQAPHLINAITAFPPSSLRTWADGLGADSFIGSSHRVFPRALKASPLLRAWIQRLETLGVTIQTRTCWEGWDAQGFLCFRKADGTLHHHKPDATLLALGGASWPRLGSDGRWTSLLREKQIEISPLRPSNCGFLSRWSPVFTERFTGAPLKTARFSFNGKSVRSEAVITRQGIEGSALYALSSALRDAIDRDGYADLVLDLAPDQNSDILIQRLSKTRRKETLSNRLRKGAHLSALSISLLREGSNGPNLPQDPTMLVQRIKELKIRLVGIAPLDKAISTAGGISFKNLDSRLMLTALPGVFAAGEMLDWEAPTGGYLLQACFSTAIAVAHGITQWLVAQHPPECADTSSPPLNG